MRDDRERLLDVMEAIEQIEKYAARGKEAFDKDELIQAWVRSQLQIMGEACRGVSSSLREKHPQIPWTKIVGLRNILVHRYFGVDTEVVWAVVERDLPDLKEKVRSVLQELPT